MSANGPGEGRSFGVAQRRGLAEEAADLVREAILAGRVRPGAPLREVDLAAQLGVSRGSVRAGLEILDREGLIDSGWHRGTRVREVTVTDVDEVYSLRAALDALAARTARTTSTPEQLAALRHSVADLEREALGPARPDRLVALDLRFHDLIYEAAGSTRLTLAWQAIRVQTQLFQLHRVNQDYGHYRSRVVAEHRAIAEMLADPGVSVIALTDYVTQHVAAARAGLLAALSATLSDGGR
jgi:DNA-binding GntR family transcriptional regulator